MTLGLFKKTQPEDNPAPTTSGKQVLREAISARVKKKENLQSLVQMIRATQDNLISFSEGADNLDEAQLSAVAMYVFGNPTYSQELDKLVSQAAPATNMGIAPAPYQPSTAVNYPAPFTPRPEIAPAPAAPGMVDTSKYRKAPGWAS
jgi:hypothetical protein